MTAIVTVNGTISPDELGVTLTHEHTLSNLIPWLTPPSTTPLTRLANAHVTMDILYDLKKYPHTCRDNLVIDDIDLIVEELGRFKSMGGRSIADVSTAEIGRDPLSIRSISIATGLNIICTTGWYIEASHPAYVKEKNVDELSEIICHELSVEIGKTGIRAGIIKAAAGVEFTENEKKVMRAAGRAQARTGAPLTIHTWHPVHTVHRASEYLDILAKEDANLAKTYLSHMDQSLTWDGPTLDMRYHKSLIEKYGVVLNYDGFGNDQHNEDVYPGTSMPSDRERLVAVVELLKAGYEKNLMLGHDTVKKFQLRNYGGPGYAHILVTIVPDLRYRGVSQTQIDTMLVDNPKRVMAW